VAVRSLTGRSSLPDTWHTPCRDSKPKSKSAQSSLGDLDIVLIHHSVTVAVQVNAITPTWGAVGFTSVNRRIVVRHWQETKIFRNDRKDFHDKHQDHDTMHPTWNQPYKNPGSENSDSVGTRKETARTLSGHTSLTRVRRVTLDTYPFIARVTLCHL